MLFNSTEASRLLSAYEIMDIIQVLYSLTISSLCCHEHEISILSCILRDKCTHLGLTRLNLGHSVLGVTLLRISKFFLM